MLPIYARPLRSLSKKEGRDGHPLTIKKVVDTFPIERWVATGNLRRSLIIPMPLGEADAGRLVGSGLYL
jgi:hypothetical protein